MQAALLLCNEECLHKNSLKTASHLRRAFKSLHLARRELNVIRTLSKSLIEEIKGTKKRREAEKKSQKLRNIKLYERMTIARQKALLKKINNLQRLADIIEKRLTIVSDSSFELRSEMVQDLLQIFPRSSEQAGTSNKEDEKSFQDVPSSQTSTQKRNKKKVTPASEPKAANSAVKGKSVSSTNDVSSSTKGKKKQAKDEL